MNVAFFFFSKRLIAEINWICLTRNDARVFLYKLWLMRFQLTCTNQQTVERAICKHFRVRETQSLSGEVVGALRSNDTLHVTPSAWTLLHILQIQPFEFAQVIYCHASIKSSRSSWSIGEGARGVFTCRNSMTLRRSGTLVWREAHAAVQSPRRISPTVTERWTPWKSNLNETERRCPSST